MDQQNNQMNWNAAGFVQKNASYYRERARGFLRPCYWMAVLALFLAVLLGGVSLMSVSVDFETSSSNESGTITLSPEKVLEILDRIETIGLWETIRGSSVISMIIVIATSSVMFAVLTNLFVGGPVEVGYRKFQLNMADRAQPDIGVLFSYFKISYLKTVLLRLLYSLILFVIYIPLYVMFGLYAFQFLHAILVLMTQGAAAGSAEVFALMPTALVLLMVAFGVSVLQILVQLRYGFATTILAEYPEMRAIDALRTSATLMKGKKWRLFCLEFSFIGWILLGAIVPFGVGMYFVQPYVEAARIAFYDDISNRHVGADTEFPSLDPNDYDPNQAQW